MHCSLTYHLKCLNAECEPSFSCYLCSNTQSGNRDTVFSPLDNDVDIIAKFHGLLDRRGFRMVHQNIRSVTRKIDELRFLVSELISRIELIALTETWINDEILDDEISIPGYQLFRKDRDTRNGGDAVFVKTDLLVTRRFDLESPNIEGLWLEVSFPKSKSFLVGTFYRPLNSSNYANSDFMDNFESMLEKGSTTASEQEVIVMGDFNCDYWANRSRIPECKKLKNIFKFLQFSQLMKKPTRTVQDSGTVLDLVSTNYPKNINNSGMIATGLSDHDLVFCVRKINSTESPPEIRTFRNYAKFDREKFKHELREVDWNVSEESLETSQSNQLHVEEHWNNFKTKFITVVDHHANVIQKRMRGTNNCPWMNAEIKHKIRERDYTLKKARKSKLGF